jgi:hypothetical protein
MAVERVVNRRARPWRDIESGSTRPRTEASRLNDPIPRTREFNIMRRKPQAESFRERRLIKPDSLPMASKLIRLKREERAWEG